MARRLSGNLTSDWLAAADRMKPKNAKRRIVVYVEGYDDILFWHTLLSNIETDDRYFEVMLPSRTSLGKGKKVALMNALNEGLGRNLIVCVDADYDYLLQGATDVSRIICNNPYVFHTIAYAIENCQCYAPSLHTLCVMATLNDRIAFDFESFMAEYSKILFPLLIWSVWCYRYERYDKFNLHDMGQLIHLEEIRTGNPDRMLYGLRRKVNQKISWLQRNLPEAHKHLKVVEEDVRRLGVTPETTYLFVRGHDIFENVVLPLVERVCRELTNEREREIMRLALHETQKKNELLSYEHASASALEMLRKQSNYMYCPLYRKIIEQIKAKIS